MLKEAESVGSSAIFEVLISPSTAITSWMKDGSNIRESPKHKFIADGKDRKLHIIDVQLSDAGEYTCVLRLGNKEKTSTAKLIVEGIACLKFIGRLLLLQLEVVLCNFTGVGRCILLLPSITTHII